MHCCVCTVSPLQDEQLVLFCGCKKCLLWLGSCVVIRSVWVRVDTRTLVETRESEKSIFGYGADVKRCEAFLVNDAQKRGVDFLLRPVNPSFRSSTVVQ